jgi:hypothetical protein
MSGLYVLAAIPVVLWACMLYVLVVDPVRLYLHDRRAKRLVRDRTIGPSEVPANRGVTVLPRP